MNGTFLSKCSYARHYLYFEHLSEVEVTIAEDVLELGVLGGAGVHPQQVELDAEVLVSLQDGVAEAADITTAAADARGLVLAEALLAERLLVAKANVLDLRVRSIALLEVV